MSSTRKLVEEILNEIIWKRVERVNETLNLETATLGGVVGVSLLPTRVGSSTPP